MAQAINLANPFKNPKPFDTGRVFETPDLRNISYTAFDFYSIKARTIEYVKKYFPDDYNDFVESDLGIMLIQLWAFMADLISFKLDLYANEVYIDTVSQRKNVHRIAKLVGYPVRPPRAATARISVNVTDPYAFDVIIERAYSISIPSRDGNALLMELYAADEEWNPIFDEDIVIPAGATTNLSIVALEGSNSSTSSVSDGTKYQTVITSGRAVLDGSIKVSVNNQIWSEVDFFNENDNGSYYRVEYNENYQALIMFSDDVKGRIPPQGSNININYRNGGGSRGNIVSGFINQIVNVTSNAVPGAIPVIITNYTAGEGGEEAESIDEIKTKLPLWVKSQNRAVTGEDYSFLSESYSTLYHGRIGKAKAVLRNSGCSGNIIDIYVLQLDSENSLKTANSTLKKDLETFMFEKKMLTDFICIKDASQVFQDMNINVEIDRFYLDFKKDIRDRVIDKINDFFALERWSIGDSLRKYDLVQYLNSIKNISSVNIDLVFNNQNLVQGADAVMVDFWKIIRPGTINISINTIN